MYTELPQRFVHNTYFTIYGIVKDFTLSFGKFTAHKYFLFRKAVYRYGIKVIMLITPETSEERVREIDAHTDGFIYMVSSAATTGAQQDFNEQKRAYFKKIEDMNLRNPLMVGFGISNKATFQAACEHASGAIIGSRFVTLPEEEKDPEKAILKLKEALR